jgi:uncharacterized membrane protein
MTKHHKKKCQVCGQKFDMKDLYPNALIRNNILEIAAKQYPDIDKEGFVCFHDLRNISSLHYEEILKKERGFLSELDKEVIESISKHQLLSENTNEEFEQSLTFGEKLSDTIAKFGGSWSFILIFAFVLISWIFINSIQLLQTPLDPFPFIFLNLILSCLAAVQAPIIMMSQNRQAAKDRLSLENNYQTNLKAELQIRQLNTRLELFMRHNWEIMLEISRNQEDMLSEILDKNGNND